MSSSAVDTDTCSAGAELRLQNVCAGFGDVEVLRIESLEIESGEFVSVVGPSGCGKSTLLRLMAKLLLPVSGTIQIQGPDGTAGICTGFVFQDATLLPWRTAAANIRLPGELEDAVISSSRIHELARLVGLSASDLQKRPAALSGGMKMRVSLARALALEPQLLLLDEPFAAVDDLLRQQLQDDVLRIQKKLGLTAVMVTHNVAEAVYMGDRVVTLGGGTPATMSGTTEISLDRTGDVRGSMGFAESLGAVMSALRTPSSR